MADSVVSARWAYDLLIAAQAIDLIIAEGLTPSAQDLITLRNASTALRSISSRIATIEVRNGGGGA